MKLNKIFIILLILILLFFSFTIDSLASFAFTHNSTDYILSDLPFEVSGKDFFIGYSADFANDGDYFLCFNNTSNQEDKFLCDAQRVGIFTMDKKEIFCEKYIYHNDTNVWEKVSGTFMNQSFSGGDIIYSTLNICQYFNEEDVFFLKAPPIALVGAIQEVTQLPMVIQGVLKVIIPGSLIVLSMVLLIFLIKSAISRMV